MMRTQRGVSLLFVAVILILIVGSILAFLALFSSSHGGASTADTTARLQKAQVALEQFASVTGRLPCPANPGLDSGDEDPGGGGACNSAAGTVPWRTISLRQDDGLDAWGRKISYRVYAGPAGSLTQDNGASQNNGASMVLCTIGAPASPGFAPTGVGLCWMDAGGHHTDVREFLANKGLSVVDYGTSHGDAAYVLISHGPSGRGAYGVGGARGPLPSGTDEIANTTANGPFVARAAATAGVSVDDAGNNFFDDILVYRSIFDLGTKANIAARNWPDPTFASVLANASAVVAAVIAAGGAAPTSTDLGVQSLAFNNATVSVQAGATPENLSLSNAAGLDGIGGGGGGATLSSADAEVLHVTFSNPAQVFAVTLNGFACRQTAGACTDSDAVQFTFFKDGTPLLTPPVTKLACNTLGVASYTIDLGASPGGDFNSVDIAPLPTVPAAGVTQALVGGFVNCPEGGLACVTAADTGSGPGGNHCP
jgi:type II secretory pathway pseudopilin PulG